MSAANTPGPLYLDRAIAGFDADPPDSDFQDGYMAALHTLRNESGYHLVHDALAEIVAAVAAYEGNHSKAPTKRLHHAMLAGKFALAKARGEQ